MFELAIVKKYYVTVSLGWRVCKYSVIKLQVYPCPAEPYLCFSENNVDPDKLASDEAI